jgi:PPK2 family polyphosphate:nucleotide phosphotransferase
VLDARRGASDNRDQRISPVGAPRSTGLFALCRRRRHAVAPPAPREIQAMDFRKRYIVEPGSHVQLDRLDPNDTGSYASKEEAAKPLQACLCRMRELQYRMYAENKRSLLIVLQGRDAAGKDGTIRKVLSVMNPQGCTVTSFKVPSTLEASHDFLWRCHLVVPRRGNVAIFNRSHYEDVLVVRVHALVPHKVWSRRYDHINAFEELLYDNHTEILKFFLHIDRDEQLKRFKRRLDDPGKQWKISDADYSERPFWDDYTQAFEEALQRCSTKHAPWFVIPSNRKWFRNLAIARIIVDTLLDMNMQYPEPAVDLEEIRQKYHAAANASE